MSQVVIRSKEPAALTHAPRLLIKSRLTGDHTAGAALTNTLDFTFAAERMDALSLVVSSRKNPPYLALTASRRFLRDHPKGEANEDRPCVLIPGWLQI